MDALLALSLSWLVLLALLKSIATVALWVCAAVGAVCKLKRKEPAAETAGSNDARPAGKEPATHAERHSLTSTRE